MSAAANSERVRVGPESAMPEGHQTSVEMDGISVLVVNYEGQFYALRNNCTHQDYPLLGGEVQMGRITCQKHGAKFELATGKAKSLPAVKPVRLFKTEVEDGVVYVASL
ncbi:non-heme iron oxygenase ferredoxin subunit [Deinococcus sp. SM5_A1]|uniref:non-heme iron oxygenase ferredoxin subunit n=1 Tax=Deinococcus sp. SM5_A1 TaxID=3379094 RepID=UPI00385F6E97